MKKVVLLLLIGIIICTGFSNQMPLLTDYRDPYVGNYFCNSNCQSLNSDHTAIIINPDTLTISVEKDPLDSIIKITIGSCKYPVKLKNSIMYSEPFGRHWGGKFFSADSIGFSLSVTLGPNVCTYIGKKTELH